MSDELKDDYELEEAFYSLLGDPRHRLLLGLLTGARSSRNAESVTHYRTLLWSALVDRLKRLELFAFGFRNGSYEKETIELSFAEVALPDFARNTLTLAGAAYHGVRIRKSRPSDLFRAREQTKGSKNKGGRPPSFDWLPFYQEAIRFALTPDGFNTRAELSAHMKAWCANSWADQPDESTLGKKVSEICPPELSEK